MENLDELMRKKFESDQPAERFAFREEYWEQAEALLEAEEKRRKRRRWLFWWLFGGAAAVAVAVAVAVEVGSSSLARRSPGKGGSSSDKGNWQSERPEDATGRYKDIGYDGQKLGDTAVINSITGEKMLRTDTAFLNSTPADQGALTGRRSPERQETTGTKGGSSKGTGAVRSELQSRQNRNNTNSSGGANTAKTPSGNEPDLPEKYPPAHGKEQAGNDLFPKLSDTTNTPDLTGNAPEDFMAPEGLPIVWQLLDLPVRNLDTPHAATYVQLIKPVKNNKLSFGLAVAGAINQASPDGKRVGAVGGLFAHYRLASSWSLTTGVQWRFLPGTWINDTLTESGQLRYSFGFQKDDWMLETRGLHMIEVPIGLRWHRRSLMAEAGFMPGFLLGVQGRLTQQHSESLQDATTRRSKVWLNNAAYNRFSPSLFLGGEWRVKPRLGATLRVTYRPGGFGENPAPDEPPPANLFWLDAGLRWYLKN